LRSVILSWYAKHDPASEINEDGDAYSVHISPCAMERKIVSMEAVEKRLGKTLFLELVNLPLTKLDACVPLREQGALVRKERIGPRMLKPIAKLKQSTAA
jgi:hypothetical protein